MSTVKPAASNENIVKILLVEDDFMHIEYFQNLCKKNNQLCLVKVIMDGNQVLSVVNPETIDLIVMDYRLGDHEVWGVELAREIIKKNSKMKILFWSAHIGEKHINDAKNVGVLGYVNKRRSDTDLLQAINVVKRGRQFWTTEEPRVNGNANKLTKKQTEVMEILAMGRSNLLIADELLKREYQENEADYGKPYVKKTYGELSGFITVEKLEGRIRTVDKHIKDIKKKLGLKNRVELIKKAVRDYGRLEQQRDIQFSEKEIEVLVAKSDGKSIKEISAEFKLCEDEVRSILEKFGFVDA